MARAKQQGQSYKLAAKVGKANSAYKKAEQAYQTIRTLLSWFQFDVLPLTSVAPQSRELLYDFIFEELKPYLHIGGVNKFYKSMLNQRAHLLKVIYQLDNKLKAISEKFHIEQSIVWKIAHCARYDMNAPTYHEKSEKLEQTIGPAFDEIEDAVLTAIDSLHTTSSMVENYNSRLKPFLDERKGFQRHRLALFQFILNHHPFARSEHQTYKGKTAAELMSGKPHPHWLKMLGFTPFSRTA